MKFNELLKLNQEAALPDPERIRKRVLTRRSKIIKSVIACSSACAALILVAVCVVMASMRITPDEVILSGAMNIIESVEASDQSEMGLRTDSKLKIKTKESVSVGELKARLAVSPEAEYTIKKTGECSYELHFKDELQENTLYNVEAVYNGKVIYRWAFQTEGAFSVTNAYPENTDQVALDSAIEVTFSHADVSGFESAFQISPAVKGTFEHYGRTWAFIPSEKMSPATLYTVTIANSVSGPDQLSLERDYVFSFTTAPLGSYAYLIYQDGDIADTFLVNESPVAAVCYNQASISDAKVSIYRLADSEAYIRAYKNYVRSGVVSAEIMEMAQDIYATFETEPVLAADYNGYSKAAFIHYPEPLSLGYYFAEIQLGTRKLYQLIESTTLSVYTVTTNGDYTIWVNNTQTGKPVSGAKIKLDGFGESSTNEEGVVTYRGAREEANERFLQIENGDYPYVAVLNGAAADADITQQNRYYTYITTNSSLYKNTDTVQVFGMILPRKSGVKLPKQLTLQCDFLEEAVLADVAENGSFTAALSLNHTAQLSGSIQLYLENTFLDSTYFNIADYELPTYELNVTTDRFVYQIGDTVSVTAQATYMDGTPAPGLQISGGMGLEGISDENGCVTGSFVLAEASYVATDKSYPEMQSISCTIEDGTDQYYGNDARYLVFSSPYFLEGSYEDQKLSVSASQIDFDQVEQWNRDTLYTDVYNSDLYRGTGATLTLTGELHEVTYTKEQIGSSYDAINKRVQYAYRYEEQDTLVRAFEVSVSEGTGSISLPEKPDNDRNYYVLLQTAGEDEAGMIKVYLTDHNYERQYNTNQFYNLVADKNELNIGDRANLWVRESDSNSLVNGGSVFYTVIAGEIIETHTSSTPRFSLTFKKEFAPDVAVYGAYFDGKHVYSLGYEQLNYDLSNAQLNISMEADTAQYQPGDEVTLRFKVTDQQGEPVSAVLNLSVLDRALYLLNNNVVDPVYSLYESKSFCTQVYTTVSYRDFRLKDVGGGEGGGDGGETRSNFEDTPYTNTVETDASGEAVVSFELPDTITQWKVVARAVSQDVEAGIGLFDLLSTQDYFASVSMAEQLKTTDDCTIAVKGDGWGIPPESSCTFQVGITDRDGNEIKTLTASAGKSKYAYLNFGMLDEGIYTAYIQSTCGNYKDSLIQTFQVKKSLASVWVHNQQAVEGSAAFNLTPASGNVTLTVVDENLAFWQQAMVRLKASNGVRVDQVLGQYLADVFYENGVWMDPEKTDYAVIRSYMQYDGIRLFADNPEVDLKVSAKLAAAAPQFCDRALLKGAFEQYLNNRYAARVDVITAYFGLAALGEPVLGDLQALYEQSADLTLEESVYLALGFAYGGDYDTARYIFEQRLQSALVREGETLYVKNGAAEDEDLTGCLSLLSNRLSLESSEGLIGYILERDTEKTLLNLELISYLNDHITDITGQNKVTVNTGDGRSETYTYQKMNALVLNLTPEQASSVRIMNVEGKSVVSYAYMGTPDALSALGGGQIFSGLQAPSAISRGGAATIRIQVDIPADYELPQLALTLPAGLRFESGTISAGNTEYPLFAGFDKRNITASLQKGENTVLLEVRGSLPGNYELEPVLITNTADNRFLASDVLRITVTE